MHSYAGSWLELIYLKYGARSLKEIPNISGNWWCKREYKLSKAVLFLVTSEEQAFQTTD